MSSKNFLDEKWVKKIDREIQGLRNRVGVDRKTIDEIFDKSTLLCLGKLISDHIIDTLDFPIYTGKEGNVFRGSTPDNKFVAIKIYRTSTATFKHILKYITGDPRFKTVTKNRRDIIFTWTKKENKNLKRLKEAGVRAPTPITMIKNILVMEYIGDNVKPANMLRDMKLTNPKKIYDTLVKFILLMYRKAGLIHSDLSSFNVLIYKNLPYLIDLGQGVLVEHPLAHDFLKRDITNIVQHFNKYNIYGDAKQIYNTITKTRT